MTALAPNGASYHPNLTALDQWVTWRYEKRDGKLTKVPYNPRSNHKADSTDPQTWTSFPTALTAWQNSKGIYDGIGCVFAAEGGLAGIDLDHCRDAATGEVAPWARAILDDLDSYAEPSPSGTGIHVWARGAIPGDRRVGSIDGHKVEMYDSGRFFTITGHHLDGTPTTINHRQEALERLYNRVFPKASLPPATGSGSLSDTFNITKLDDADLLVIAASAKNAIKFRALWEGKWPPLRDEDGKAIYPSQNEADLAFCHLLAFYAADAEQIDRLFRRSKLFRPKWDEVHFAGGVTYGQHTIALAIGRTNEGGKHYTPPAPDAGESGASHDDGQSSGDTRPSDTSRCWPERQPLPDPPATPTLPPELIPDPLRAWCVDIAERASIPLECVATPAIGGLAAAVGRGLAIQPERFNDWAVVPNLWGGLVAPPGWLKSYLVDEAMGHLKRIEMKALQEYQDNRFDRVAEVERLEAEIAALKQRMQQASKPAKAGDTAVSLDDLQRELRDKLEDREHKAAGPRRLMTQDATVEKLGELLEANRNGILVLRDELAGWLRTLDKAGREGDREFFLEAWNGNGSYTFDRIGRGTVFIPAVCVSLFGGIQPGKLRSYIAEAVAGEAGADGLLQRLQLLVWPDAIGPWRKVERWPNTEARARAARVYQSLVDLDGRRFCQFCQCPSGASADPAGAACPIHRLRFDDSAQGLFDRWRDRLENRLRGGALNGAEAFTSHLSKYRSLMPSLALLFHLVNVVDGEVNASAGVSLEAAKLAAAWCDFLEAHARKVYAAELDDGLGSAHALAARIEAGKVRDGMNVRDIYRTQWAELSTRACVDRALVRLAELGWVRVETMPVGPMGGRPEEVVRLHPEIRGGQA